MSAAIGTLELKLASLISRQASVFGQAERELRELRDLLQWMHSFLNRADAQLLQDERLKVMVEHTREASFEAEDAIDEFMLKINGGQHRLNNFKSLSSRLRHVHTLRLIRKLKSRMRYINSRVDTIMKHANNFKVFESKVDPCSSYTDMTFGPLVVRYQGKKITPAAVENKCIVGVEDDTELVYQMVIKGVKSRQVVAIVGMGGLGKTTVARRVYDRAGEHFGCRCWVDVPEEFTMRQILLGILHSLMSSDDLQEQGVTEMIEAQLVEKVSNLLRNQKYLIVMDDVWINRVWEGLSSYIPEGEEGSKVLITTRNEEITKHAISQPPPNIASTSSEIGEHKETWQEGTLVHRLRTLDHDESWQLLRQRAFGDANLLLPPDLEVVGRQIVARCSGLPLAIEVVAGILSSKPITPFAWRNVLQSVNWHLSQGPYSCMKILALSYHDLPPYLKQCFLYCGIFPKSNISVKVVDTVQLWLAEGFIEERGEQPLEHIAEDYLYELACRNMIEMVQETIDERMRSWRMHDLLRQLAISVGREFRTFETYSGTSIASHTIRRLACQEIDLSNGNLSERLSGCHLRSVICFNTLHLPKTRSLKCFQKNVKFLVVLSLGWSNESIRLPKAIGELFHLKLLKIQCDKVTIPSSIKRLVNLQTLDVKSSSHSVLPCGILKLKQLRYLKCPCLEMSSFKVKNADLGIERLTNLHTLSLLGGSWLEGGGLGKITQLKSLRLVEWEGWAPCYNSAFSQSISTLTALRSLHLVNMDITRGPIVKSKWCKCIPNLMVSSSGHMNVELPNLVSRLIPFSHHSNLISLSLNGKLELPEEMEFYPPNLLKLKLTRSYMQNDPMIVLEKLPKLRFLMLSFESYDGEKLAVSSNGFPQLRSLHILGLFHLKEFVMEEGAMPHLRDLKFFWCHQLKKLPRELLELKILEVQPESIYKAIIQQVEEGQ